MKPGKLTRLAHEALSDSIGPGDHVIDATTGNGHDTLFMAQLVGDEGRVYGLDIQTSALENTRNRLEQHGLMHRSILHLSGHEDLLDLIDIDLHNKISAVVFNLGYLPGGDKSIITRTETTLRAVDQAMEILKPRGLLCVTCYPGHPGGDTETVAVQGWSHETHQSSLEKQVITSAPGGPVLFLIRK